MRRYITIVLLVTASLQIPFAPYSPRPTYVDQLNLLFKKNAKLGDIFPEPGTTGYIGITEEPEKNKLFFWYWDSRDNKEDDPLVIWLTGGPGCSSELAITFENGPFSVDPDTMNVLKEAYSWNNNANLLFVDHPIGTGFSTADSKDLAKNATMIREYFYEFITTWLQDERFKRFQGHPLYITGESYAGHYVPQIANRLFLSSNPMINLQGIAIGNGWVRPSTQSLGYVQYSFDNNLVNESDKPLVSALGNACDFMIDYPNPRLAFGPDDVCGALSEKITVKDGKVKFNYYNIDLPCIGDLCYDFTFLVNFFNQKSVQTAMGVDKNIAWTTCDGPVGDALSRQDGDTDASTYLHALLEGGLRVLFYNGVLDWICNWKGTEMMLYDFNWSGQSQWNNIPYSEGPYGLTKTYKNLQFIRFNGAGHMVPHDQKELSVAMLNEFIHPKN